MNSEGDLSWLSPLAEDSRPLYLKIVEALAAARSIGRLQPGDRLPPPSGLSLPALIRSGIEGLLKRFSAEALLSYHPGPGSPAERAAGSYWLAAAGGRLPVERVALGSGAQALLAAVLLSQTREGDTILTDTLTYPG
ncbi:MAG: hypothetical protein E5X19_12940, partial [Mesorhizobium sp.]